MVRHETVVTPVPLAELEKVLQKRWATRWQERNPNGIAEYPEDDGIAVFRTQATAEEYEAGVKGLLNGYRDSGLTEDTAWAATCKCGWTANNPLPTKQAAEADAEAHMTSIYGEA